MNSGLRCQTRIHLAALALNLHYTVFSVIPGMVGLNF